MSRATRIAIAGLTSLALTLASTASASQQSDAIAGTIVTAAATGIFCATLALGGADSDDEQKPYARRGPMIGLGANVAVGPLGEGSKLANASYGLHASGGYRCSRHLASEFEIEWHGGYAPVAGIDYKPLVATSNTRVYVLTGRLQPYLLLGGGLMRISPAGSTTGYTIRAGTGLDFYLSESFVLNGKLDYVRAFQGIRGVDYLTLGLGLGYRF